MSAINQFKCRHARCRAINYYGLYTHACSCKQAMESTTTTEVIWLWGDFFCFSFVWKEAFKSLRHAAPYWNPHFELKINRAHLYRNKRPCQLPRIVAIDMNLLQMSKGNRRDRQRLHNEDRSFFLHWWTALPCFCFVVVMVGNFFCKILIKIILKRSGKWNSSSDARRSSN